MPRPIKLIREVDLQAKCKEAILEMGGKSMKMSNRFLIGVPDLYCQLPGMLTSFWEVKSANSMFAERQSTGVTPAQKKWLRGHHLSGGLGGVIHFVMLNDLNVAIYPTHRFEYNDLKSLWTVYKKDLVALPRGCKFEPFKDLIMKVHAQETSAWIRRNM